MENPEILIIEDEPNIRNILAKILTLEGYTVYTAENGMKGLHLAKEKQVSVVITDVKLPDINGIELVEKIKTEKSSVEVIVLTAYGNVIDAVKAMKFGAFDYLRKGEDDDKIPFVVKRAIEKKNLTKRVKQLESRVSELSDFNSIIGLSPSFLKSIEMAKKVAATNTSVLLLGETGTGKELFAESIHHGSKRRLDPFIAVNCASIPKELQESEFFGHKKGSFTGAIYDKKGFFEEANHGTLFLDEIGEMNHDLQAKLLRALETNTIQRIGDMNPILVDIRIIAATNRNLTEQIANEKFRRDLFYRLNTFTIDIPPLRERKDDIEILLKHFIKSLSSKLDKQISKYTSGFLDKLISYNFPGNIRELKNIIERAIILSENGILSEELLPLELAGQIPYVEETDNQSIESVEKNHIIKVLNEVKGNKNEAAAILKIGLTTLYRKLKDFGLEP
jgi:two-component system, NtrC family, response regulator